jgi:hypothetical protein
LVVIPAKAGIQRLFVLDTCLRGYDDTGGMPERKTARRTAASLPLWCVRAVVAFVLIISFVVRFKNQFEPGPLSLYRLFLSYFTNRFIAHHPKPSTHKTNTHLAFPIASIVLTAYARKHIKKNNPPAATPLFLWTRYPNNLSPINIRNPIKNTIQGYLSNRLSMISFICSASLLLGQSNFDAQALMLL